MSRRKPCVGSETLPGPDHRPIGVVSFQLITEEVLGRIDILVGGEFEREVTLPIPQFQPPGPVQGFPEQDASVVLPAGYDPLPEHLQSGEHRFPGIGIGPEIGRIEIVDAVDAAHEQPAVVRHGSPLGPGIALQTVIAHITLYAPRSGLVAIEPLTAVDATGRRRGLP